MSLQYKSRIIYFPGYVVINVNVKRPTSWNTVLFLSIYESPTLMCGLTRTQMQSGQG